MTLIAQGMVTAKPDVWGFTESSTKKTVQFAIEFVISEGEDAGRRITWFGGFEGKGADYTADNLERCGWDRVTNIASDEMRLDKEVRLTIIHDEWDGELRAKVKYINGLDEEFGPGALIEKMKMSPDKAKAFANDFMNRMGGSQANGQRQQSNGQRPPANGQRPTTLQKPAPRPAAAQPMYRPAQQPAQKPAQRQQPPQPPQPQQTQQQEDDVYTQDDEPTPF